MTTSSPTTTDAVLPQHCPSWCSDGPSGHRQAYSEGCEQPEARIHTGGDLIGQTADIDGECLRWNLWLRSDPGEDCRYNGLPFVEFEAHIVGGGDVEKIRLDTGAARVLARQLLHFADAADLES